MKKITLLCYEYYDIQQGIKNFLCTDGTRPILGYIYIIVKDQRVTFEACDGFMAIRKYFNIPEKNPSEDFEAFIPELKVPAKYAVPLTIEKVDDYTIVEWKINDNVTTIKIHDPEDKWPIDLNDMMKPADHNEEIGVTSALLIKALRPFKRHCKLYIPDNKTSPIYIKPFKDESCWDTEAIVLPARERK